MVRLSGENTCLSTAGPFMITCATRSLRASLNQSQVNGHEALLEVSEGDHSGRIFSGSHWFGSALGRPMQHSVCEAFNGRMHNKRLNEAVCHDLCHARDALARWITPYNETRPHGPSQRRSGANLNTGHSTPNG
jgi:hypothetical protein